MTVIAHDRLEPEAGGLTEAGVELPFFDYHFAEIDERQIVREG